MNDFYTLADQLHTKLTALFERYPSLDPRKPSIVVVSYSTLTNWIRFGKACENVGICLGKQLLPTVKSVVTGITRLDKEYERRVKLYNKLDRFMPNGCAAWIAWYIPERWIRSE